MMPDPRRDVPPSRPLARLAAGAVLAALLAGCASILGGGSDERTTVYSPDPRAALDPALPRVSWQLALGATTGPRTVDSYRIAVRPTPDEVQVYRGAGWARTPSEMLQSTVLRALEDSGKIGSVARQGTGFAADYRLLIDLRRFEADYAAKPVWLTENYRSTAHIIAAANAVIGPAAQRMKAGHDITVNRARAKAMPGGDWAALDPVARRELLRGIVEQAIDSGTTVLFSSHIVSDLERVASRVAFLHQGRLLLDRSLDELKEDVVRVAVPADAAARLPASLPGELVRRPVRPEEALRRHPASTLRRHAQ